MNNITGADAREATGVSIGLNAQRIIEKRYSLKNDKGEPTESWGQIVHRVLSHVSQAETRSDKRTSFYQAMLPIMQRREFLPNTPALVNAGKVNAQLAGCFVLDVPDSITGIMKAATDTAVIHKSGGGTGFTFEKLRPANSIVNSTHGVASGPVSFMEIIDKVTDVIKQGGVRRGANMGIMRVDHPDILRFIHAKNNQHSLLNFNISVTVTDEFMLAVENKEWIQTKFNGQPWTEPIFDPLTGEEYDWHAKLYRGKLYAPDVWDRIIKSAHQYGEPGVIFIDTVNKANHLKESMGEIRATNPCAEQPLHENNSCNLGSIDLSKFFVPGKTNWQESFAWGRFREVVRWSVRFLDNVIDTCNWPIPEIDDVVKRTRPIGLGVMGFADLLLKMQIRYGSPESENILRGLMKEFQTTAWEASIELGEEKGAFPEYEKNKKAYTNFLSELGLRGAPRNWETTTIAPTGTISLVAETSSGIEPNFAWSFVRADTVGTRTYVHPLAAEAIGLWVDSTNQDSVEFAAHEVGRFSDQLPDYFVTAHDLTAEQHVRMLAAAQTHIDSGVSKTCNGHAEDTVESVKSLYELAYKLGVKAVSYYRDGSRENQVLTRSGTEVASKKCPDCEAELDIHDGCQTCTNCGYGMCSI
jgi:ribonucleoside-diphosphate reductase alpha chain